MQQKYFVLQVHEGLSAIFWNQQNKDTGKQPRLATKISLVGFYYKTHFYPQSVNQGGSSSWGQKQFYKLTSYSEKPTIACTATH